MDTTVYVFFAIAAMSAFDVAKYIAILDRAEKAAVCYAVEGEKVVQSALVAPHRLVPVFHGGECVLSEEV